MQEWGLLTIAGVNEFERFLSDNPSFVILNGGSRYFASRS